MISRKLLILARLTGVAGLLLCLGVPAVAFCVFAATAGWADVGQNAKQKYGVPGKASDVTRTIDVTALDMAFQMKSFRVRSGETIRFVVKNEDEVDHDFTIAPPAMQAAHRKKMMEMMESEDGMSKMHNESNAVFVKPGETKELIWKFAKVGGIEFACNLPGHYESGMKGMFTARQPGS